MHLPRPAVTRSPGKRITHGGDSDGAYRVDRLDAADQESAKGIDTHSDLALGCALQLPVNLRFRAGRVTEYQQAYDSIKPYGPSC